METKHTPGPWTVTVDPDACGRYDIREHRIAEEAIESAADRCLEDDPLGLGAENADKLFESQSALREANKALIAAAPDLLAALEKVIAWLDAGCDPSRVSLENARAAIAKAKGGAA